MALLLAVMLATALLPAQRSQTLIPVRIDAILDASNELVGACGEESLVVIGGDLAWATSPA